MILPLKLDWRQVADVPVTAYRIVEHFDIVKNVAAGVLSVFVGPSLDPLTLQELEEALGNGVVVAVSPAAHAWF